MTAWCTAVAPRNANAPNPVHTSAYPPSRAAIAVRRRGPFADTAANSATSGRLDGSIIAAIMTCQASRNTASATTIGNRPSICAC